MGTSSPLDVTQLSLLVAQITHRGLFFLLNTFYTQKRNVKKLLVLFFTLNTNVGK